MPLDGETGFLLAAMRCHRVVRSRNDVSASFGIDPDADVGGVAVGGFGGGFGDEFEFAMGVIDQHSCRSSMKTA